MKIVQYQCDVCKNKYSMESDSIHGYDMVEHSTMASNVMTYLPIDKAQKHICTFCIIVMSTPPSFLPR